MKRLSDVLLASIGLLVTAPILVAAMLLIRLDSPGKAIFRQQRVGIGGEPFTLLKLRSMTADASTLGPHSTMSDDPRVTRVGALIRRTSLDELPQLINVLKGEMSLVGPRPDVPAQEADYTPDEWRRRTSVRPGITGLAQVSGRSAASAEQRLAKDLEYVDTNSFLGDMKICVLTIRQLLIGDSN